MHIEAKPFCRVGGVIAQKIIDIARGYSSEDKARVTRIIKDPSSISIGDIEKYKQHILDSLIPLGININPVFPVPSNLAAFFEERERQSGLTFEQLAKEVELDAQRQAREWKLRPGD